MSNLSIKCAVFLFVISICKKCEGWSPVCMFEEDKDRVWIRILSYPYDSKYLHPIGDYSGNQVIQYGLKKLWIPCGDSKKEYMLVGWFKNIYGVDGKIGRSYNILMWVAVFRKGHSLAKLGGQWIDLVYFDCKLRRNFMNNINKRVDLYDYAFPILKKDPTCENPYLIQFTFYELKENISVDDIVKRNICPENSRYFYVDNPFLRINEITKKELGTVSLAYCKSEYIAMELRSKISDEIRKYVEFCKNNPLPDPIIPEVDTSRDKNGDTPNQQGGIQNPIDPSKEPNLIQCNNPPTDEEKELIRKEMESKVSNDDDIQEEINYFIAINGKSDATPENQND